MNSELDVVKFYRDDVNEWRWKRTAPNNEEVGAATEGYKNLGDCVANATRLNGMGVIYVNPEGDQ